MSDFNTRKEKTAAEEIKRLLDVADGEIGNWEEPAGSNRTKYGALYGLDGNPWCVMFIWWCFRRAGLGDKFYGGGKTASCSEYLDWAKKQGQVIYGGYKAGDLVFMNFSGGTSPQHIGVVESANRAYAVTIEGNTSNGASQSNGGMVMRKQRDYDSVVCGVRPNYGDSSGALEGEEIYLKLREYLMSLPVPGWAERELSEAVEMGITDGQCPGLFATRCEAAIMAKRAAEGKWACRDI